MQYIYKIVTINILKILTKKDKIASNYGQNINEIC